MQVPGSEPMPIAGAESAAPSYNFVEELEATVNDVKRSGVSDVVVSRLSRVFDDAASRLSHAALLGQALLEERENLREKLREISGEAEKRLTATFDENHRLRAERDELHESCTKLEKTCSQYEREKHQSEQRLLAIVEQFREEEEKWRSSLARPQARRPDSRVQDLMDEMDSVNIQHAKEVELLKSENAALRAENHRLSRMPTNTQPTHQTDPAEVEHLRAEAQRAGRLDGKLKEALKTIERLQREAVDLEEERGKLEAVVEPLMKANRVFQNEQTAQAALIEELRKELAAVKQQLADKEAALLGINSLGGAAAAVPSTGSEIRGARRKQSGSQLRPRSTMIKADAFTGLVDQLRSSSQPQLNASSSLPSLAPPSAPASAPASAHASPTTSAHAADGSVASSPTQAAASSVDTATWLMLTSLEKELEQVATIASSLQQPVETSPPPPATPPSAPAALVPPMLSLPSPRIDELDALRPPHSRVQFEYTKLDKIADRPAILSDAQLQALTDAEKEMILMQLTMLRAQWVDERKKEDEFLERVVRLRGKLRDANLTRMNQTMRSILSFRELIDVSNIYLDCVLRESTRLQTTLSVPIFHVILELLIEISVLQKRNNDYSEGINAPLLDKLDQFERDWRRPQPPPPRPSPPPASPSEKPGFLSMLSSKLFSPAKSDAKRRDSAPGEVPRSPH